MPETSQSMQKPMNEQAEAAGKPSRLRQVVQQGCRRMADWSEVLTRRKYQQRGGLYLPLVGIGRGD